MNFDRLEQIKRFDIQLGDTIPANTEGNLEYVFNFPCSIEAMTITFPIGSKNELQVTPYLLRPDGGVVDLVQFVGNKYIAGDNAVKPYKPAKHVQLGYKLVVHYKNIGAESHGFDSTFACDTLNGPMRVDVKLGGRR